MSSAPPAPQVEHLPTIFRKIRTGEYRVPPFQREFVWNEKQVVELLESVYRGFPIGSVLLWKVDTKVFKSGSQPNTGFPKVDERYPTSFVLDGVQRMSTLFGVFNSEKMPHDSRLDVLFDLEREEFFTRKDRRAGGIAIPLGSVFSTKSFLEEQRKLAAKPDGDVLLDRAVKLLSIFQEYMLPIVSISNSDPNEVVQIFERINSTGTRLGVVDFMRALTWSDDFDLSKEITALRERLLESGFEFDEETILKALGIVCHLKPLPDVLLKLRDRSAAELHLAVDRLGYVLNVVTRFVSETTGIANSDALPYEAQWLFLVRLASQGSALQAIASEVLKWVRATSFSEALQGRPDHALARMIDDQVEQIEAGGSIRLPRVETGIEEIIFKRFLRGKAMTVAFVEMLVRRGVFEQRPLSAIPYEDFVPIADIRSLSEAFHREASSARTIGNVVYLPGKKGWRSGGVSTIEDLINWSDTGNEGFLSGQFISPQVIGLFRAGKIADALIARAMAIAAEALL